jgi:hypothetical protein
MPVFEEDALPAPQLDALIAFILSTGESTGE